MSYAKEGQKLAWNTGNLGSLVGLKSTISLSGSCSPIIQNRAFEIPKIESRNLLKGNLNFEKFIVYITGSFYGGGRLKRHAILDRDLWTGSTLPDHSAERIALIQNSITLRIKWNLEALAWDSNFSCKIHISKNSASLQIKRNKLHFVVVL